MTRRVGSFLQIDVSRAIRAAKREGADAIQVASNGTITILLKALTVVPSNEDEFQKWDRNNESAKAARHRDR